MALPFEQQPRESAKAFAAFSMYLSLGPERSLSAVAKKLGKGQRIMETWSQKFDWAARVQAHDAHLALVEREAAEALARVRGVDWVKRQEEQRADEWQARCEALELAREAIHRWKENAKRCGTLEGIARLLDLASKLGRLASGMPTDRTEVTTEVQGKIDVEWEIALKRVYGQAAKPEVTASPANAPAVVVDVEVLADGHREVSNG
ncbi:MAG TPA: hypothetical protein PKZ55_08370 [Verrucomicrobiota bacterium]|jgi:hypothetical protein|nr:hypothetical protein [Verrucomicrobiota bacterium]HOH40780.1 hypothetical protein [Verrucomicrobiota bacterium]HOX62985.1 hypothetical protein [Verrucomicrobiota bacterium]HPI66337.1 hypothetical protein [Verrucomicrobiota bacterium]HPO42539.1 hypothetical protein [Verrucomicrobiota bacterium]